MARGGKRLGAGRKAGVPNRLTGELKNLILGALEDAGGQKYLTKQAEKNPGAFLTLLGKVVPRDLTIEARTSLEELICGGGHAGEGARD